MHRVFLTQPLEIRPELVLLEQGRLAHIDGVQRHAVGVCGQQVGLLGDGFGHDQVSLSVLISVS